MLVDDILQGVDDDTPLASCILFESPLKDLVLAYNQLSIANPDIPSFSANWTGKDFKKALRKLESKKQITLLYNYVSVTKEKGDRITYIESETSVAKRLNQQLAIKVFLLMCGFFTIMFFLFVLFVAVSFDFLPQEGEEYKTVLAIAKDILKYIFTVK